MRGQHSGDKVPSELQHLYTQHNLKEILRRIEKVFW